MAEPSKVVHVRNVGPEISEADVSALASSFGTVQKIVMIRSKNQALVQMQDVTAAISMMQYYSTLQPSVRGRNVYMQFSSHQELSSADSPAGRKHTDQPNRILLVTIHNPLYPINVDVLHQVFSPHGFVEKIVTFQKSAGLQALVQYNSQQSAMTAKATLQGRNIYDGCCMLDIQFSDLPELRVNYNNERTRDYTNNQLPEQAGPGAPAAARGGGVAGGSNLMVSLFGEGGSLFGLQGGPRGAVGFQQQPGGIPGGTLGLGPCQQSPMQSAAAQVAALGGTLPSGITGTNDRSTLLISNLNPERMDPDKLFNLLCNYGNVLKIKMLHNKPDHALVEMSDGLQAEMTFHFLKGVTVFGKRLEVNYSKHPHINASAETREYSSSKLNRWQLYAEAYSQLSYTVEAQEFLLFSKQLKWL
eukprot:TRINITY_DN2682_c0_g2_i3.p1 TRINITY_DN2682_c0_g2~~TRINITY_DN2682_c0_g2_i3.p1  ORF type:complete len:436 (+),score=102.16 TRINITY_DN2682_c0_g2_i3:62-1309(+)